MSTDDHEARHDLDHARHETRHDLDDQHDLRQEQRDAVTRTEVASLIESVEGLESAIEGLSEKMDRQWNAQGRKRRRLAVWLAAFVVVSAYAFVVAIDHHVGRCMTFGSVENERTQWWCDVTVPFHDHPIGGLSEEVMEDVIDRADRIRQGRP